MADSDKLVICDNDWVGGVSKIDGFFDLDFISSATNPESGYIGAGEVVFGNGGIAPVVMRAIRESTNNRLVLAFMCRFSRAFTQDSAVMVLLKPTFAGTVHADERKIIIQPMSDGIGAAPGDGDTPPDPYQVKNDKAAHLDFYYKGDAGTGWTAINKPAGLDLKVRSWIHTWPAQLNPDGSYSSFDESAWSVEISLPITKAVGGTDWIDLSNDIGLFFCVAKILPLISGSATVYRYPPIVPSGAEAGKPVTGFLSTYSPNKSDYAHASFPHKQATDLSNTEYSGVGFDNAWQGIGCRPQGTSGALTGTIQGNGAPAGTPDNQIVARLRNNGSTAANDITCEFRFHRWGLGPSDPLLWNAPSDLINNPAPKRDGAAIEPAFNLGAGTTGEITAKWARTAPGLAALGSGDTCMWAQLSARTPVVFGVSSVRRNMTFVNLSESTSEAEISGEGYPAPPDGAADHDFVIETFMRRIAVSELVGAPELDPSLIAIVKQSIEGAPNFDGQPGIAGNIKAVAVNQGAAYKETVVFVWQSLGYRVTADTLTIGANTYPLLDNGCGAFGQVAHHTGVDDNFGWTIAGAGVVQYAPGLYGVKVPHGGKTTIMVTLNAGPEAPKGDSANKLPPGVFVPPKPGGGTGGGPDDGTDGGTDGGATPPGGCLALLGLLLKLFGIGK